MVSLVFLIFNIAGIILGKLTNNYMECFIIVGLAYVISMTFVKKTKHVVALSLAVIFAIYGSFSYIKMNNRQSFKEYKNKYVRVVANVVSPIIYKDKLGYCEIKTQSIKHKEQTEHIEKKLPLVTDKDTLKKIHGYGTQLKILGQIKIPGDNRNIGGFNYKRYQASKNIEGEIFAKSKLIEIGQKTEHNIIIEMGQKLNQKIVNTIDSLLREKEASLLKAILLGYKGDLDKNTKSDLKCVGFAHILCVSGINLVYLVFMVKYVLKVIGLRRKFVSPLLILVIGLYVLIVGFTPSIVRAAITMILSLMGEIVFYRSNSISNISVAALIILIINPMSLYDVGFQFSFAVTLGIILYMDYVQKWLSNLKIPPILRNNMGVCICVRLWIAPLEMYYFGKYFIFGIISNVCISMFHSMTIALGMIMVMLGNISHNLAKPIAVIEQFILKYIIVISEKIAQIPYISIKPIYISKVVVIAYYVALITIYLYKNNDRIRIFLGRNRNKIVISVAIIICVSFCIPKELRVDFMDVGQGDCALIRTKYGKNILIDGGGCIDANTIVRNNVTKIDIMIATHGHMDHIGGLFNVLDAMKVDKLIVPDTKFIGEMGQLLKRVEKTKTSVYRLKDKDTINVDKYTKIEFLNPKIGSLVTGENANSLVFKLKYKDVSFLFTGDVTDEGELEMLRQKNDLNADVLKIAHHGSITSTTDKFLSAVAPKAAVISVGEGNRFEHPCGEVLERLNDRSIMVLRTDKSGQISMTTNGKSIKIRKRIME